MTDNIVNLADYRAEPESIAPMIVMGELSPREQAHIEWILAIDSQEIQSANDNRFDGD